MKYALHKKLLLLLVTFLAAPAIATTLRFSPDYPDIALENCIEGYVTVSFTVIDKKATDVKVIAAEPEGIFEQSAIDNLQRMHFDKPDGFTYKELRFTFKLDGDCGNPESGERGQATEHG